MHFGSVASRTLGNAFAEALTVVADVLVRSPEDDKRAFAMTVLRALMDQRQHAQEKRASWVVSFTRLLQTSNHGAQAVRIPPGLILQVEGVSEMTCLLCWTARLPRR